MSKQRNRRGKFQEWITPEGLIKIEGWARDGLTNEQIAKNIGINPDTLYTWMKKYPEVSESLKKGKEIVDREVENALLKRALGYEYEEVKTYIEETGGKKKKRVEKITRHIPADTTAGIFWLRNRKGEAWRNRDVVDVKRIEAETEKLKLEADKLAREETHQSDSQENKLENYLKVLGDVFDDD